MGCVKSYNHITLTLADGNTSVTQSLTGYGITSYTQCVPFFTKRITNDPATTNDWTNMATRVYISGSDLIAETTNASSRAIVVEVWLVEFDSTRVRVQSGSYTISDGSTTSGDVAIDPAIVKANTFLFHSWKVASINAGAENAHSVRGQIIDTNSLEFDRHGGTGAGATTGTWFIAEALDGAFVVREAIFTCAEGQTTSTSSAFTAVDEDKSFVLASMKVPTETTDNNREWPRIYLTAGADPTTVTAERNAGNYTVSIAAYVVQLAGNESVRRGAVNPGADLESFTVTLDPAATSLAMPMTPISACMKNCENASTSPTDNPDAQFALDFSDTTHLRFQHLTPGNETSLDISWEIIEWELYTATSRRIFIIT